MPQILLCYYERKNIMIIDYITMDWFRQVVNSDKINMISPGH